MNIGGCVLNPGWVFSLHGFTGPGKIFAGSFFSGFSERSFRKYIMRKKNSRSSRNFFENFFRNIFEFFQALPTLERFRKKLPVG